MQKVCELESCGIEFDATREDARYCSGACRAKASRERREELGPESGPSQVIDDPPSDADRLEGLEQRLADLEEEADAHQAELEELRALGRRLATIEEGVRRQTEAAVAVLRDELALLRRNALPRSELAETRALLERVERCVASAERGPSGADNADQVERAVIVLARRVTALRGDFDRLVAGIARG